MAIEYRIRKPKNHIYWELAILLVGVLWIGILKKHLDDEAIAELNATTIQP